MKYGKTLKIFVMSSDPKSLKTVELVNWTGQAFIGSREYISQIRDRKELSEPGVYMLLSDDADDGGSTEIYIGETDSFQDRVSDHLSNKDWWSRFIVFVSKDKNLTKAHVKYLERELHTLAKQDLGTLTVKNRNEPSGSSLPESDQHSMSEFLQNIIFVMETLGLGYFPTAGRSINMSASTSSPINSSPYEKREWSEASNHEGMEFFLTLPDKLDPSGKEQYKSFMTVRNGFYVLKAGSFIRKEALKAFHGHAYYNLWEKISKSDAVQSHPNSNLLTTARDIEFKSPSGAGAIVYGGQTNGKTAWKRVSDEMALGRCEPMRTEKPAA